MKRKFSQHKIDESIKKIRRCVDHIKTTPKTTTKTFCSLHVSQTVVSILSGIQSSLWTPTRTESCWTNAWRRQQYSISRPPRGTIFWLNTRSLNVLQLLEDLSKLEDNLELQRWYEMITHESRASMECSQEPT